MIVFIRGGGDLASGVALRLHHAGLNVIIAELPEPLVVRRLASFAEAVYQGQTKVEDVVGRKAVDLAQALAILDRGEVPVLIDPDARTIQQVRAFALNRPSLSQSRQERKVQSEIRNPKSVILVDARMLKRPPDLGLDAADLVIGLGPGFWAGQNCHAVVETNRGHSLGRVIWQGAAEPDTGAPEWVHEWGVERVLRAPVDGLLVGHAQIGDHLEPGQAVAEVAGQVVAAPFRGVLRGLLRPGVRVWQGLKIGDIDPRDDPSYCAMVSDKSLAVGGGVLEAILARVECRSFLWSTDATVTGAAPKKY